MSKVSWGGVTLTTDGYAGELARYDDVTLVVVPETTAQSNGHVSVTTTSRELPDLTSEVTRGIAWLDLRVPGWWEKIDTDHLDLEDENSCVLGQTWSHYADCNQLLGRSGTRFQRFIDSAFGGDTSGSARYGFALPSWVYAWVNLQVSRHDDEHHCCRAGMVSECAFARDLVAAVFEHLTKTWLVAVKARRKHAARPDPLIGVVEAMINEADGDVGELVRRLRERGLE